MTEPVQKLSSILSGQDAINKDVAKVLRELTEVVRDINAELRDLKNALLLLAAEVDKKANRSTTDD